MKSKYKKNSKLKKSNKPAKFTYWQKFLSKQTHSALQWKNAWKKASTFKACAVTDFPMEWTHYTDDIQFPKDSKILLWGFNFAEACGDRDITDMKYYYEIIKERAVKLAID